jgi:hypothetical protein
MGRWIVAVCAAGLLQACGTFSGTVSGDPGREIVGVMAHQPDQGDAAAPAPSPAADRKLDWQQSQLCSLGAMPVREDVEPGDADQQLVDRLVRCQPYEFSIFGVSLAGIVPQVSIPTIWPF